MNILFRIRIDLLDAVRRDLLRKHAFAAERVGHFACRAGRLSNGGLVVLAASYQAVADEDYVEDHNVGAMIGSSAIRKALQCAYNGGLGDLAMFHVHMHVHNGLPGFSRVDRTESLKFVPDFFNVAPLMPHGTVVLSRDRAAGMCWRPEERKPATIDQFVAVGAPLHMWGKA